MSEYLGARISLISKSDIRYVGTLVSIDSEASTVSLDNVRSFGTEGRRGGKDEYAPSSVVYDQIVFRGSDVKDLRIEEPVKESKPEPPPMPDDPAIIGVQRPQSRPEVPRNQQPPSQAPPNFPQHGQFPPGYPPYGPGFQNQRFGPQGAFPGAPGPFPGPYGMPGPYGAPPGWYPPNQGFNQPPGPFSPPMPIGPPGAQNQNQQPPPGTKPSASAPIGPPVSKEQKPKVSEADGAAKPVEIKPAANTSQTPPAPSVRALAEKKPPTPPIESKPDVATALAPPATQPPKVVAPKTAPTGPKNGRIVPAVPLASPNVTKATASHPAPAQKPTGAAPARPTQTVASAAIHDATQAATAAVAAAMAKLDLQTGQRSTQQPKGDTPMDNLTKKVNEMRADDQIRHGKQPGTGGYAAGRGTGRGRGGRGTYHPHAKIEVPTTDFDFESANAKFNKQELVKEAIASGSPLVDGVPSAEAVANGQANGTADKPAEAEVVIPSGSAYDKSASFFDNISSELKDREDSGARRGQEFRSQERQKNMETFGQGSVDGFRGGYRGRGRGRGFGRGRGGGYRGRGPRSRGGAPGTEASAA